MNPPWKYSKRYQETWDPPNGKAAGKSSTQKCRMRGGICVIIPTTWFFWESATGMGKCHGDGILVPNKVVQQPEKNRVKKRTPFRSLFLKCLFVGINLTCHQEVGLNSKVSSKNHSLVERTSTVGSLYGSFLVTPDSDHNLWCMSRIESDQWTPPQKKTGLCCSFKRKLVKFWGFVIFEMHPVILLLPLKFSSVFSPVHLSEAGKSSKSFEDRGAWSVVGWFLAPHGARYIFLVGMSIMNVFYNPYTYHFPNQSMMFSFTAPLLSWFWWF